MHFFNANGYAKRLFLPIYLLSMDMRRRSSLHFNGDRSRGSISVSRGGVSVHGLPGCGHYRQDLFSFSFRSLSIHGLSLTIRGFRCSFFLLSFLFPLEELLFFRSLNVADPVRGFSFFFFVPIVDFVRPFSLIFSLVSLSHLFST